MRVERHWMKNKNQSVDAHIWKRCTQEPFQHEFKNKRKVSNSRYSNYIFLFGIVFTALQISDLTLTKHALKDPELIEINPLYGQDWFIPFKLTMVFLVMITMYRQPVHTRGFAIKAMSGMIIIYVLINLNNLYFILK